MTNQEKITNEVNKQLEAFKKPGIEITEDSIPSQVLNTRPDQGSVTSLNNLKMFLHAYLMLNGYWKKSDKRRFLSSWMNLPVKDLVQKLLILVMILISTSSYSQLEINLGANRTEAKNAAISIGLMYAKSFDSIWASQDYFNVTTKSLFSFAPEIDIQTGNEDAFSSLQFKLTGQYMRFRTEIVEGGDISIDASKTFHVFPISAGIETSNYFDNANAIVELGWIPWYQTNTNRLPEVIKHTTVGVWLQSGYKFQLADSTARTFGGKTDQSEEDPNTFILRVKGNIGFDTQTLLQINGLKVGFVGRLTGWADIANSAFYRSIDMRSRFYLTDNSWIDFVWQKGSMAPLFNNGTQTGLAATIKF